MNAVAAETPQTTRRDRVRLFVQHFRELHGMLPTLRDLVEQFPFAQEPITPGDHADLAGVELSGRFFWRGSWRRS